MNPRRRRWLAMPLLLGCTGAWLARAQPPRIAVALRKFSFSPAHITVKRGQSLTLVLSSSDFVHGFALPDFKLRVDVVPGNPAELTFTPEKAGKFHLLCDNFCGEGHDQMSGYLIVVD